MVSLAIKNVPLIIQYGYHSLPTMPMHKLQLSTKKGSSLHKYRRLANPTNIDNRQETDTASEDDVGYVQEKKETLQKTHTERMLLCNIVAKLTAPQGEEDFIEYFCECIQIN